jgi:hypothetical protein
MKRVIGLLAAMLIFSLPAWAEQHPAAAIPRAILRLMGKWAGRLVRLVMVLAVLLGLLYVGDWLVLRVRVSHVTAYGVVQVNQFLATPLKGNKVEYDLMGTVPMTCSRSIFPQQGNPACWWLRRHTSQWE